jgi:hypothetical protein
VVGSAVACAEGDASVCEALGDGDAAVGDCDDTAGVGDPLDDDKEFVQPDTATIAPTSTNTAHIIRTFRIIFHHLKSFNEKV